MENKLTNEEIVFRIMGDITPVGETNEDNKRFDNLKSMCELVDKLVCKIDDVANDFKNRHEFSVKRASEYASNFLTDLGINKTTI